MGSSAGDRAQGVHSPGPRSRCIRCGECCSNSSPTLQIEDVALIRNGFITGRSIYTIRKGEVVRDNINGRLKVTPQEMIKIREHGKGSQGLSLL